MSTKGKAKRKPLTNEELQRMDQLLRCDSDLSFDVIALRMNCNRSVVQGRNKKMEIRIFSHGSEPKPKKPIKRFKLRYEDVKGGFL